MKKLIFCLLIITLIAPIAVNAQTLEEKFKGKFLLSVEQGGRIWYVSPKDEKKYEVSFDTAMNLFEQMAVGISNKNLLKLPIDPMSVSKDKDTDGDGYNDRFEVEQNFNPFGDDKPSFDHEMVKKFTGYLLLAVEDKGRIWYVDFDGLRTEITWANMIDMFINKSHGFSNADLDKIPTGPALKLKTPQQEIINCDGYSTCLYEAAKRNLAASSYLTAESSVKFSQITEESFSGIVTRFNPSKFHDIYIEFIPKTEKSMQLKFEVLNDYLEFNEAELAAFYERYRAWDFTDEEIFQILYSGYYNYTPLTFDYEPEQRETSITCSVGNETIMNIIDFIENNAYFLVENMLDNLLDFDMCSGKVRGTESTKAQARIMRNDARYKHMEIMKTTLALMCVDGIDTIYPNSGIFNSRVIGLPYADSKGSDIHRYIDFSYIYDPIFWGVCETMDSGCEYTVVTNNLETWSPCNYGIVFNTELSENTLQTKCLTPNGIIDITNFDQCRP